MLFNNKIHYECNKKQVTNILFNLGIFVKPKKYFFVIFFLCSMVSDQKLFCSQRSETDKLLELKIGLYRQYKSELSDLDRADFDQVFDFYMSHNNATAIHEAVLLDRPGINSKFGQTVQKAVKKKIRLRVIQELKEFCKNKTMNDVYDEIVKKIIKEDLFAKSDFFPELFFPVLEHYAHTLNDPSTLLSDKVSLINDYYDFFQDVFARILSTKERTFFADQKYIKPFVKVLNNYAKEHDMKLIEFGLVVEDLSSLFNQELQNTNQQTSSDQTNFMAVASTNSLPTAAVAQPEMYNELLDVVVNNLSSDALKLYECYQQQIGSFSLHLFAAILNEYAHFDENENFLVDAYNQDTAKIESLFGIMLKNVVCKSRYLTELESLSLKFKDNPSLYSVVQEKIKNITESDLPIKAQCFAKLFTLTLDHYAHEFNDQLNSPEFVRDWIDKHYDKLFHSFVCIRDAGEYDLIQTQKQIECFVTLINERVNTSGVQQMLQSLQMCSAVMKAEFKYLLTKKPHNSKELKKSTPASGKKIAKKGTSGTTQADCFAPLLNLVENEERAKKKALDIKKRKDFEVLENKQRGLIDSEQRLEHESFDSLKQVSLQRAFEQERVSLFDVAIAYLTEAEKKIYDDLSNYCLALRNQFVEELEETKLIEKLFAHYSAPKSIPARVDAYSFCKFNDPHLQKLYKSLMDISSLKESARSEIDEEGSTWYLAQNYKWRALPDGSRICKHDGLNMVGKVDSFGRAFFAVENRWKLLN